MGNAPAGRTLLSDRPRREVSFRRRRSFSLMISLISAAGRNFLALSDEQPVFGVMVGVHESEDDAVHMAGVRAAEIGGVEKIKSDGLAVWRGGRDHARLVARAAVMRHQQAIVVQVDH